MKIDNIDSITNKEKSPDKAERTTSIEDIKKTQSNFFDFTNELAASTATVAAETLGNNLFESAESREFDTGSSKLKKLLLNNRDPEVASEHNNESNVIKHEEPPSNEGPLQENHTTADDTTFSAKKDVNSTLSPPLPPQPKKDVSGKQKLFLCSECNEYFLKLNLFNHMKCVHSKFTCLYCYGFFEKVEKLQQHLVRKHKVQNVAFYDEQTLKNCFDANFAQNEVSADVTSSKVINAVCCKCACIFNISENSFHTHNCVGKASTALISKQNNSLAVQQNENNSIAKNNNQHSQFNDVAKEDIFCEQAIQKWLQPTTTTTSTTITTNNNNNYSNNNVIRTTFNGALSEISSQSNVPLLLPPHDTRPVTQSSSSSANTSSSSSISCHESQQQRITNNNIENNNKLVPKLTLKIPKTAFKHQQQQQQQSFGNIDSNEDSGDEEEDSGEDDDKVEDEEESNVSESENEKLTRNDESSSLSENDDKENDEHQAQEVRRPDMPCLKLKIKNLTSNPESVLENFSQITQSETMEADADLSECPMDLEEQQQQPLQLLSQTEQPDKPKEIFIDGALVVPANEDIRPHEINLDEALDKIDLRKLMKICLNASYTFCLYCNHARKIVVNGKALAIHFIKHHRFYAMVDSITAEELHPEKIVEKFVASVDELKDNFFNLNTYDDHDQVKREGHVTVSHDKLYECFQCRFQTSIHKELYLHNRKMHAKSLINCLMCKMSFYNYSELLCHICPGVPNKQEFNDYKFYCCLCNLTNIPSAFRLMVHLRRQHYACDVCLEKCCDQSKLSSHVWKHKLMHICYRCHVFYQNKADITKHLFWKHGTEGIECKKCLQKKWPHVYHFCIPPAAFTCPHCEMTFTRAMALKIHLRLHGEEDAKYPCLEIGCEKKFISKKLLLRHVERHQSEHAALENVDQERSSEGTVIIPKEIPDGFCTRIMPVVFKRFTKKPAVRKVIDDAVKVEEKIEEIKKEEKKELPELPETNLNLSESSDSGSSSSSEDESEKPSVLAPLLTPTVSQPKPQSNATAQITQQGGSLTDSEDEDDKKTSEPMKNILENLKTFQECQQLQSTTDKAQPVKEEVKNEEKCEVDIPDKLPEKMILHVCQSDHDYSKLWRPISDSIDLEDMIEKQKIDKDRNKKKSQQKNKKKSTKNEDFSSSDSSSGSSSDSSSGSSSGSSSSGSSSSTSDSSSSEASSLNTSKPRTKKFTKKRCKKEKKVAESEDVEIPRDPDEIIYESDLQTDETDTDEDFYDEHPLKNSQQKQITEGIIENSRPTTPLLPPVVEKIEKRNKVKKRKKEHRKSLSSPSKRQRMDVNYRQPIIHTSTPVAPRIELHQANQIRQLLQSTQQQPVLPILKEQQQPQYDPYINVSRVTSASSSRINSDTEAAIKRSQRKRIPNKFYGYTSDDESMAAHLATNDPFKPVPPPNLTWRKEDLPSRCKSPPKVAPIKLNLNQTEPQIYSHDHQVNTPMPVNNSLNNHSDDSVSSEGGEQLFISEPRQRKRKLPQSQSMYAFHTLETPPTISQPPIPRLKLTIGSNNKIRRRNINPLKPPAIRKKKVVNKSLNSIGAGRKSNAASLQSHPTARILKSPPSIISDSEIFSVKQAVESRDKQQKLEEAIQNTQMYFQRYNHAQFVSNEIPQESTDGDGRVYCYCRRAYDEQQGMIGCDGPSCQIEWFHFECVGILVPPRGSWYCPQCQKDQQPTN